uniref:Uncharacterized protein n=1 Tax=Perkinsus marinus TaxID=31276 RepID=C9VXM3_9ALVE|nr:unknown protein [Perkinsus marinus]
MLKIITFILLSVYALALKGYESNEQPTATRLCWSIDCPDVSTCEWSNVDNSGFCWRGHGDCLCRLSLDR